MDPVNKLLAGQTLHDFITASAGCDLCDPILALRTWSQ